MAIELGYLNAPVEKGINKNVLQAIQLSVQDAVADLENCTESVQLKLKDFLYHGLYHKTVLFPAIVSEDTQGLLSCKLIEQVDDMATAIQAFSRNQIMQILDAHGVVGFKRNMSLKSLATWCAENITNLSAIFPTVATFRFTDCFKSAQRKVYTYLLRKFSYDIVLIPDSTGNLIEAKIPHGAIHKATIAVSDGTIDLVLNFPDDDITQLLTQYGHNRCL